MRKLHDKFMLLLGFLLILIGAFGWGYTYMSDHRHASSLSAYCDIDFKADVDQQGNISTANLTIWDYRYSNAHLEPLLILKCDDNSYRIEAVTRQTPPSYSLIFFNEKTTLKNTNKLFAEIPLEAFDAIRKADKIQVEFFYDNKDTISLPLNESDLAYWQEQMR